MTNIFVSYSRRDQKAARQLVEELLDAGYEVWFDAINIHGGMAWKQEIEDGIKACDICLVLWSPSAEISEWVEKEVQMAQAQGKTIIPILLDGDYGDLVKDLHGHDFTGDFQQAWKKLAAELPVSGRKSLNLRKLLEAGNVTFGDVHRRWRDTIEFGGVVGILIGRSAYGGKAYLLGERDDKLTSPDIVQVALQFSGLVDDDPFLEEIIPYLQAHKQRIWIILVQGMQGETFKGWGYTIPNDKPEVWTDMTRLAWHGIHRGIYASAELHFFMKAPNTLALAIGAHEHFKNPMEVYNLQRDKPVGKDRYISVYRYEPA